MSVDDDSAIMAEAPRNEWWWGWLLILVLVFVGGNGGGSSGDGLAMKESFVWFDGGIVGFRGVVW